MKHRNLIITTMLSFIALCATTTAQSKYTPDDSAVINAYQKELCSYHIAHLFEPWPEIVEDVLCNPFKTYVRFFKSPSPKLRQYLQQNRILIENLDEQLSRKDKVNKNEDKIPDKEKLLKGRANPLCDKFFSLLLYHPAYIQAKEEEASQRDYLDYMSRDGCDRINGVLRGDLSVNWSFWYGLEPAPKKDKAPATWGTSLDTDLDGAMYYMESALRLNRYLSHLELEKMTLYRGICLPKVLDSVTEDNRPIIEEAVRKVTFGDSERENLSNKNIIYRAKDISSTSKNRETALDFALRVWENSRALPVVLEITVNKGTGFGKDTERSDTQEVMLKPGQKMKINSVEKIPYTSDEYAVDYYILLKCETVAD